MPINSVTPSSGTASQGLSISTTANTSRNSTSKRYRIKVNNEVVGNTLTITQAGAALAISSTSTLTPSIVRGGTNITLSGTANGRYIYYENTGGLSVTELKENSSGSWTVHNGTREGGAVTTFGNTYDYSITLFAPGTTQVGNKSFTVYTADYVNNSWDVEGVTYTITVEATAPAVSSISLNPNVVSLGTGSYTDVDIEVLPAGAPTGVMLHDNTNPSVATASLSAVDGKLRIIAPSQQGNFSGNTTITIKSSSDQSKRASCSVNVYSMGVINCETSIQRDAGTNGYSLALSTFNLSGAPSANIRVGGSGWMTLGAIYAQGASGNYVLPINTTYNTASGSSVRQAEIRITGTDLVGNTITKDVVYVQTNTVLLQSISITPSGNITLNNSNNTREFMVSFYPSNTTQRGFNWVLTSDNPGFTSNDAEVIPDPDPAAETTGYLTLYHSQYVDGTTMELKAVSTSATDPMTGLPIESNIVTVYPTYNGSSQLHNISVSNSEITVSAFDDRCDTTNGAPTITGTGIIGNIEIDPSSLTGFLAEQGSNAYMLGNTLYAEFSYNSGQQRTASVTLRDSGDYSVTATVQYTQLAYSNPGNNRIDILALEGYPDPVSPTSVKFAVNFDNKQIYSETFSGLYCNLTGKNGNTTTISMSNIALSPSSVTVYARETSYVIFEVPVSPIGNTYSYDLTVVATCMSQVISDSASNWDGTDDVGPGNSEEEIH